MSDPDKAEWLRLAETLPPEELVWVFEDRAELRTIRDELKEEVRILTEGVIGRAEIIEMRLRDIAQLKAENERLAARIREHVKHARDCKEPGRLVACEQEVERLAALLLDKEAHDPGPNNLPFDCLQFALEEKGKRLEQIAEIERLAARVEELEPMAECRHRSTTVAMSGCVCSDCNMYLLTAPYPPRKDQP